MPDSDPNTTAHGGNGAPAPIKLSALSAAERSEVFERAASHLLDRYQFSRDSALGFPDSRSATVGYGRDYTQALGYLDKLTIPQYRQRYERYGIAQRIVEAYPKATWGGGLDVMDDPDPDTTTPFEEALLSIGQRLDIWSKFLAADVLAGIGHYGVILIGDGNKFDAELGEGVSDPNSIIFLTPLAEDHAMIKDRVRDETDPRWGQPLTYDIEVPRDDGRTTARGKPAHWSRVLHMAEGGLENPTRGRPRLRPVWNNLDDLLKLVGGGSETSWIRMNPGMVANLPLVTKDGVAVEFDQDDLDALKDQISEYQHNLRRVLYAREVDFEMLEAGQAHFAADAKFVLQLIAGTAEIPMRLLIGSERGELASTQDEGNFSDRVAERRTQFAEPTVRALVDRLVEAGAMPPPEGGDYEVVWPESEEMTESERAEVLGKYAEANKALREVQMPEVLTSDELRDRVLGLGPLSEAGGAAPPAELVRRPTRERLRHAKLRRAALRRRAQVRVASDLAPDEPDEPEWRSVHRAADAHLDAGQSLMEAFLRAPAEQDPMGLELETALAAEDTVAAGEIAARAVELAAGEFEEQVAEMLLETLDDGGRAALAVYRARGSFFRNARAARMRQRGAAFEAEFAAESQEAIEWAARNAARLVQSVSEEVREAIRATIVQGLEEQLPAQRLAQRIRNTVGLHPRQSRAVANLARELRTAEPGTLVQRFPPRPGVEDPRLRSVAGFRARVPEGGASAEWVERRTAQYSRMHLNYRARMIARTELVNAANAGQRQLWNQSMGNGLLPPDQQRVWIATGDNRTRPEHDERDGETVGVNEEWPWGTEPGAEPNCRCAQGLVDP